MKYREGEDGDENAGYVFCKYLYEIITKINNLYKNECNKKMKDLSKNQNREYLETTNCHICHEEIKCDMSFESWKSLMKTDVTDDPNDKRKFYIDPAVHRGPKVRDHW